MKIQNNYSNQNFKAKLDTASVLEVTSMKIFRNEGIEGFKHVVNGLSESPMKSTGWRGYKYFAQQAGEKIVAKYPEIEQATNEIKNILKNNPDIKKEELNKRIQPIIDKLGEVVDITI